MMRQRRVRQSHVDPDEVFLDAKNLPQFNTQQFEGVIERPITKVSVTIIGLFFLGIAVLFIIQLGFLQIKKGQAYFSQSEENRLHQVTLFSERGVIYDRNDVELAWNVVGQNGEPFSYRKYFEKPGLAHVLGFVKYPKKDSAGYFWRLDLVGAEGVEKVADTILKGDNGLQLVETDALLNEKSQSLVEPAQDGENIHLTIDAEVQATLHKAIADMVHNFGFEGGAGILMDVTNGEIITMTSYPEFDPEVLSLGQDSETISGYFNDPTKPSLNRVTAGLYTPGSTVKPFLAIGMLNEGIITPESRVYSTGTLEIPNPWNPDQPTIFRDWRPQGHGATDVYHAIADSVNKFFYVFGGGFENQKGLGIARIDKYSQLFGLAQVTGVDVGVETTGIIPTPEWKKKVFEDGTWRVGDTYNTSIGQFGFQVTPIQMVRAIAAIANDGYLVTPHVMRDLNTGQENKKIENIAPEHFTVMKDALRQTVTDGTAKILDLPYVQAAAKTGTAQTDGNKKVNAWSIGFFPYDNPRYAFTVIMERGPNKDTVGSSWAIRQLFDWMHENTPEYFE